MTAVPGAAAGRARGWWAVMALVATEGMLFALLLFTYFWLRAQASQWPLGGIAPPELLRPSIRSALLLASSATMSWAHHGIRAGRVRRLQAGLAVTLVLSGLFMAGHVHEMLTLPAEYTWRTNAYGSLWYTITNFHALHLAVGMLMLIAILVAGARGAFDAEVHLGVDVAAVYWHFVDVVWVFVFATLYLTPHLP